MINDGFLFTISEEIFQSHIAHWWSPDGARLAYATINDTLVPRMELPMFTGTPYPIGKEYHYPKVRFYPHHCFDNLSFLLFYHFNLLLFPCLIQAGEENPVITLYVVNLNGPLHTIEMRRPDDPRIG